MKPLAIISDFDGTITERDSLNLLLNRFGPSDWEKYEDLYEAGTLRGSEALEKEMSLLKIDLDQANEIILKEIKLRKDFSGFVQFCRENSIPLTIVSCNFRRFISSILSKYNFSDIPVRSNDLITTNGGFNISSGEYTHPECRECHHCKALTVKEFRENGFFTIYLGDGLTDRCPAWEADMIFARGRLKRSLDKIGMENRELDGFENLIQAISAIEKAKMPVQSSFSKDKRESKNNPFIRI
jgi:2-hydroxy-3-keto-5-methylthiopentenyl-1-phosphate phosphatase